MKRFTYFVALASITGLTLVGCDRNEQATNNPSNPNNTTAQNAANAVSNAADKTGDALNTGAHKTGDALSNATTRASDLAQEAKAKMGAATEPSDAMAPDARAIRSGLASAINDAVNTKSFTSLIKDFTDSARTRFSSSGDQNYSDLDGIITTIRGDWKNKYGNDFKVTEESLNHESIAIKQGGYISGNPGSISASGSGAAGANASDRDTAVVTFLPAGGGQAVIVPMKREGILRTWKIDVPAGFDTQTLHDRLSRELTAVKDAKDQWPADQSEAYRLASRHVLSAITNGSDRM